MLRGTTIKFIFRQYFYAQFGAKLPNLKPINISGYMVFLSGASISRNKRNGSHAYKFTSHLHKRLIQHMYFQCFILCYGSPPASAVLVKAIVVLCVFLAVAGTFCVVLAGHYYSCMLTINTDYVIADWSCWSLHKYSIFHLCFI